MTRYIRVWVNRSASRKKTKQYAKLRNKKKRKFKAHDTVICVFYLRSKPSREKNGLSLKCTLTTLSLCICIGCFSPVIVRTTTIIIIVLPRDAE